MKPQKEIDNLVNSLNHISLNHDDLLGYFLNYVKDKNNYDTGSYLNLSKISGFLEFNDFIESIVLITRESFVLAISSLTLDSSVSNIDFKKMADECINIQLQKEYILNTLEELRYIKEIDQDLNLLEIELFNFLLKYKKNIFADLIDRNIPYQIMINNKADISIQDLIRDRKEIYFNILEI